MIDTSGIMNATKDWLHAPFRQQLDIVHIFLLVGLVIVFAVMWTRILDHLKGVEIG